MKFLKMKVLDQITAKSIFYSSFGILKRLAFNQQRIKEALSPVIIRVCTTNEDADDNDDDDDDDR